MARARQKNLVGRLADVGEEAIHRLTDAPGADRLVGAMSSMRELMDDMQKKMRGLDALDRRLGALERRLDKLEGKRSASTRKVARTTAPKKPAGPGKVPGGGTEPSRSTSARSGPRKKSS